MIIGISPESRIIDVCHLIPSGDVRRAAAILAQTIAYLPPGVHVAVVDPAGGGSRRAVAVEAGDHVFLGPDNGLLSWAIHASGGARAAYELTNEDFFLKPVSPTFHGRDLFAPVAAHLAIGRDLGRAGAGDPAGPAGLAARADLAGAEGTAEGEVLSVDRHGNTQLSISAGDLVTLGVRPGDTLVVWLGRRRVVGAVPGDVRRGAPRGAGGLRRLGRAGRAGGQLRRRLPAAGPAAGSPRAAISRAMTCVIKVT